MKTFAILLLCWTALFAEIDKAREITNANECKDCTEKKPCPYTVPAGDGCNTCSGSTWCIDDKWYSYGVMNCTTLGCLRIEEIPNPYPFKNKEKR